MSALTDQLATVYLPARTALAAMVTGFYPLLIPQSTQQKNYLPAIAYQTISAYSDVSFDGPTGLANERVQITVWAPTKAGVSPIRDAVVDAMSGFKGLFGTVTVQACFKKNEVDVFEPSPDDAAAQAYGRAIDFLIWFNEPIPSYT